MTPTEAISRSLAAWHKAPLYSGWEHSWSSGLAGRPGLAGAAAVIITAADLAVANARYVTTVPQSLFESTPEVLKIIEAEERKNPRPGPYRIHRMPIWNPQGWLLSRSRDRIFEVARWEHDTLQAKHGINDGVEFTQTLGVAELYDYEWYFNAFPRTVQDRAVARQLGVELEKEVVYYPRRSYDMWNTRYFIVPYWNGGWRDEHRGYASFTFETRQLYPDRNRFRAVEGGETMEHEWAANSDFKILRNLKEYPRAWVVHEARWAQPMTGLSRALRSETFQEMLHAGDPLWNDPTQLVYDPHSLAWVSSDDVVAISPYLTSQKPRSSEAVKVSYPDPQHAILEVTLDSPGLVVLADTYYPGWELTVDGNPARSIASTERCAGRGSQRAAPPGLQL